MNTLRRILVETLSWIEIYSPPVLALLFFVVVIVGALLVIAALMNP